MKIDKKTGEILSFLPQKDVSKYQLKTIYDCSMNEDIATMYKKESQGYLLWTNA